MKKVASIIGLSVLMLVLCMPAEAQLLKKLAERAEKAAERTILNRADKEVSKSTDKAIDGILSGSDKNGTATDGTAGNGNAGPAILGGNLDDVPDAYTFSYRATMRMISDDGEMDMLYWLEPDAAYFGSTVLLGEQQSNVTVMDLERQSMVMFMETGGQKMAMRMRGNQQVIDQYVQEAAGEDSPDDVKLTPIAGKTILGYACKGFQMETDDGIAKVWVTEEAPVGSISGALYADRVPGGTLGFGAEALFMEMEYIPKKKKKDAFRMVCTDLTAAKLTIRKADYQTMALGGR